MLLYIVAPQYHQAETLAIWLGKQLQEWQYVNRPDQLRGKYGNVIVFFASWQHCDKCKKLHEEAQAMQCRILYVDDRR